MEAGARVIPPCSFGAKAWHGSPARGRGGGRKEERGRRKEGCGSKEEGGSTARTRTVSLSLPPRETKRERTKGSERKGGREEGRKSGRAEEREDLVADDEHSLHLGVDEEHQPNHDEDGPRHQPSRNPSREFRVFVLLDRPRTSEHMVAALLWMYASRSERDGAIAQAGSGEGKRSAGLRHSVRPEHPR
eukprot:1417889-Rhodomonas_salina.2